ncbi:hypothetical protein GCM10023196_085120 [Actinoallomurus vinaceus]|uniref:Uncharacterized protein n=1 Tax=Actinoallomurus vinaceus TaxID=1080074 RepID=A0ABP8UNU7_9ACTN
MTRVAITDPCRYKSDFFRRNFYAGAAELVLAMLAADEVAVPDRERIRIAECTDWGQLVEWGIRAATANSIEDVLG